MAALALAGGALYLAVLGFWVMGRLGRFLDGGGILPDWDEAARREAAKNGAAPPGGGAPEAARTALTAEEQRAPKGRAGQEGSDETSIGAPARRIL